MTVSDDVLRFEALLKLHLGFYQDLHNKVRRPKTSAQRRFQDVAWGKEQPTTEHELAYIYHLKKIGRSPLDEKLKKLPIIEENSIYPPGSRPASNEIGKKWDDSENNMKGYRSWHD